MSRRISINYSIQKAGKQVDGVHSEYVQSNAF